MAKPLFTFKAIPFYTKVEVVDWDTAKKDLGIDLSIFGGICYIYKDSSVRASFSPAEDNLINGIMHETVHIVNRIFLISGVTPDRENDELQAYMQVYIFNKIYDYIKKGKKNG